MPCQATWGSTRVSQEVDRARGKHGHKLILWFLWEGTGETRSAGLGLGSLNNFSGLCGIAAVPSCLVPGSGVIRARGIVAWSARPQ